MKEQEIIITKIESNKLNEFGKREGMKLVKIFARYGIILLLVCLISLPFSEPSFKLDFMGILYLIIMGIVSFVIFLGALFILHKWFTFQKEDVGFSKTFEIGKDYVKSTSNYESLNFFNKLSYKKMTKLYGVHLDLTIENEDIRKTKIKKREIVIYSYSRYYNPIIIPNEVENFSSILDEVKQNKSRYKLK